MKPLIEIKEPALLESGLFPSLAPNQSALWRDGANILFTDGRVSKLRGYTVEQTVTETVLGMAQSWANAQKRVYYGGNTKVWSRTDGVPTQIGSGFSSTQWSMEPWGTWLLATNNNNPPQIWKNTGVMANWPTVPVSRAQLVKKLSNFPILFSGQDYMWPNLTNIEDFVVSATSRAGRNTIRDLDSDVVAAEPMGSALAFYSQDAMGIIQFVGGTDVFGHKKMVDGVGAVGPQAVASVGQVHYGLSRKGMWKCDGSSFMQVGTPQVAKWLEDNIDWTNAGSAVVVHHEQRQMVCWFFLCKDGVRRGLALWYAKEGQPWTKINLPITAALSQMVYDSTIVAVKDGSAGVLGFLDRGDDAGASALTASLITMPLALDQTQRYKRWDMVEFEREHTGGMEVRFGYSDEPAAEPEWTTWAEMADQNWLSGRESVYLTVDVRSTGLGVSWEISGASIYGEMSGRLR